MNAALRSAVAKTLSAALQALGGAATAPAASKPRVLTAAHLGALPLFLQLIPISDLIALATGAGTVDDALSVAEAGAAIVARAFPPAAIDAEAVKLGLEALQYFIDAAGVGPAPFRIRPGARPLQGGLEGARGRI